MLKSTIYSDLNSMYVKRRNTMERIFSQGQNFSRYLYENSFVVFSKNRIVLELEILLGN